MGLLDAPQYEEPPSILTRIGQFWQARPLWQQLLFFLLVGLLIQLAGYMFGRAIDCRPGQQDGQCGLGTFIGIALGFFTGCGVFVLGCTAAILDWLSDRRVKAGKKALPVGIIVSAVIVTSILIYLVGHHFLR